MEKSSDSATTPPSTSSSSAHVGGASSTSKSTNNENVVNPCENGSASVSSYRVSPSPPKISYRPANITSKSNIECKPSLLSIMSASRLPRQEAESRAVTANTVTSATTSTSNASTSSSFSPISTSLTANSNASSSLTNTATVRHGAFMPSRRTIPVSGSLAATTLQHTSSPHAVQLPHINLNINTTTGGNFGVTVDPQISVENLKKIIAKKLKVAKDRICLLHREKELQDGTLKDNNLMDGSRIILIPNVETGLLAQRPENTVMQALESLNDSQVNDFLSGKTPLNLSMRLGDHMMLIQLQLSTVNPSNISNSMNTNSGGTGSSGSAALRARSSQRNNRSAVAASPTQHHHYHHHHHHHHQTTTIEAAGGTTSSGDGPATASNSQNQIRNGAGNAIPVGRMPVGSTSQSVGNNTLNTTNTTLTSHAAPKSAGSSSTVKSSSLSSLLTKRDYENIHNLVKSIALSQPTRLTSQSTQQLRQCAANTVNNADGTSISANSVVSTAAGFQNSSASTAAEGVPPLLEQSPIKSLSNLVSSPIKTGALKSIPISKNGSENSSSTSQVVAAETACQDPIAAKLTSCLCTQLHGGPTVKAEEVGSMVPSRSEAMITENGSVTAPQFQRSSSPLPKIVSVSSGGGCSSGSSMPVAASLHKTSNNAIMRARHRSHHYHLHHDHYHNQQLAPLLRPRPSSNALARPIRLAAQRCYDSGIGSEGEGPPTSANNARPLAASSSPAGRAKLATTAPNACVRSNELNDTAVAVSDTRTLAEASRNLTQTLRKLSKDVFTNKIDLTGGEETPRKNNSGAVIESMKNHGKGIYSGTFSGTLNPALQDRFGRPKRDISTVIHILNDLLSATPQYSRGARISFEAPSTTSAAGGGSSTNGTAVHGIRSKQLAGKHHNHQQSQSCVKCVKSQQQHGSNNACAYGECNGHYAGGKTSSTRNSNGCCKDGAATTDGSNLAVERSVCTCRWRNNSETGEREREEMCQKCATELENSKMKSKIDQLRQVMQQTKQRREARKLKGAPYGARMAGASAKAAIATTTVAVCANSSSTAMSTTVPTTLSTASTQQLASNGNNTNTPSEVSPNHIVEEVDTAA